jgi:hypothetical protein
MDINTTDSIDSSSVNSSFPTLDMDSLIPGHHICGHHIFFYDTKVECIYCEEEKQIPQEILDADPFYQVAYQLYAVQKLGEKNCESNSRPAMNATSVTVEPFPTSSSSRIS